MKLALIGDPVEHSRSPHLHRSFLQDASVDGSYVVIRVGSDGAAAAIARLREEGYTGCNVTYPLKEEAVNACDQLTDEARTARAVNTILFDRDVIGANSDGIGARVAIEEMTEESVALKRIGVLGYGATARAILAELHDNDAYTFVWGRNVQRVREACERFEADAWPQRAPEIVVSTLPPDADLPPAVISSLQYAGIVVDANYGERSTLGRRIGREVVDGMALLEAQARASFDFWLAHTVT